MKERLDAEIALIRAFYPDAEYREDARWVRLPVYRLPPGVWEQEMVEVALQIPPGYPGEAPYGIYVRPGLRLKGSGQRPQNYEEPITIPFGTDWGKFSWQQDGWKPAADMRSASNLMNVIRTFADRFRQGA